MGLISRVSSRTYRTQNQPKMTHLLHENFIKLHILDQLPSNSPLFKYYCKPENFNKILEPVPLSSSSISAQNHFSEVLFDEENLKELLEDDKLPDISKLENVAMNSNLENFISDEPSTDSSFYGSSSENEEENEKENNVKIASNQLPKNMNRKSEYREYKTLDDADLNNRRRILKK